MWIVVGLGNPGRKYSGTRHNVGFLLVERLARRWKAKIKKKKFLSRVADFRRNGESLMLALPQTYMNQSGLAVKEIFGGSKISLRNLVIVYDDLDIPLGQIRIRKEGGPGTHKGLCSVVDEIGARAFPRIRIGIGPLPNGQEATRFVLSPFRKEEKPVLERSLARAEEAVEMIISGDIDLAMNQFNQKDKSLDE